MLRRPHYIALGTVVALILLILNLPTHTSARLKLAIGSLFLPLFGLANSSQQLAGTASDALTSRSELLRQNQILRRENEQLRLQAMQLDETTRENARLQQLVAWQQKSKWNVKLAKVVLRDPANWWRTIQIDRGSRDGVRPDLPVMTMDGLVGRIGTVSFATSQVVLLGDPNCHVSGVVDDPAGDMGIIGSAGPFDGSLVEMTHLAKSAVLKPGQTVKTSGKGTVFPPGIPIGQIVDSRSVEYGLFVEARVKLAANLGALDEVWVVFP